MKYNNEIMLLVDLPQPLCPSGKQEGGTWFQLPTVDVQGHLQQHELASCSEASWAAAPRPAVDFVPFFLGGMP